MNWKLNLLLISGICFVSTQEPDEFQYNSSQFQAYYFFLSVSLNGFQIEPEDWVGAFNGDVCVGARQWGDCNGNPACDVPVLGFDFQAAATTGYMQAGQVPTFKIYDASENNIYDATPSENHEWYDLLVPVIETLTSCTHYDCEGTCGGNAEYDDCGTCSMGFTGHVPNSGMDCEGTCGGNAEFDYCGICNGPGQNIPCWDGNSYCTQYECPYNPDNCPNGTTYMDYYPGNEGSENEKKCVPENFISVNSSNQQAFYYFHSIAINGIFIDNADWVGAFNGDICVGARQWGICNGNTCDVPIMGEDGNELTEGYMQFGDIPTFKIYDASEETYYEATPSAEVAWQSMNSITIESLTFCEYESDCNNICGGSADVDCAGVCNGSAENCPDWTDDPGAYEFSATIVGAIVLLDGVQLGGEADEFVALDSNDNVRGVGSQLSPTFGPYAGTTVYEVQLRSNDVGALLHFQYYDASEDAVLDIFETYEFVINDIIGDVVDPVIYNTCVVDCAGECGGNATDEGCGCGEAGPSGCDNTCGSTEEIDECGVCGGSGPMLNYNCDGIMSSIISDIPNEFTLSNLYPNPFNPILNISYQLPTSHYTSIVIHNINGEKIMTINNGFQPPGNHMAIWDASNIASGVYLISLIDQNFNKLSKIQKAILIK